MSVGRTGGRNCALLTCMAVPICNAITGAKTEGNSLNTASAASETKRCSMSVRARSAL